MGSIISRLENKYMKLRLTLLILSALLFTSCGSNFYLKRAKLNTLKAIAHGAKIDSLKTIKHDTLYLDKIHDRIVNVTRIDTLKLKELCPEVKTSIQKKALQKAVCPEVSKDTTYTLYAKIQGKKYPIGIHIKASSIDGTASLQVDSKDLEIPFIKEVNSVNLQPGNIIKWWQVALIGLGCLIVGFILGKVVSFGVKI